MTVFIAFLMMQPVLDINILFTDAVKRYTIISPATIVRVIGIALLVFLTIRAARPARHEIQIACVFAAVTALYFVLHHWAVRSFPVPLPAAFQYSLTDEINYFIRYLLMFLLLWVSFRHEMSDDELDTTVTVLVLSICVSMVVTNLLHVSLVAYAMENIRSPYSFLAWFSGLWEKNPFIFNSMTSKGLFYTANPLSGVMTLLMPLNLAQFLRKGRLLGLFSILLQILCVFMIGSRTAVLGCILSMSAIFLIHLLFPAQTERKPWIWRTGGFLAAVMFFFLIFPFSPYAHRPNYSNEPVTATSTQTFSPTSSAASAGPLPSPAGLTPTPKSTGSTTLASGSAGTPTAPATSATQSQASSSAPQAPARFSDAQIARISAELSKKRIPNDFHLEIYPVKQDPAFWNDLNSRPISQYNDSRKLEILITARILARTEGQAVRYQALGLGRSLLANGGLYIERDYLAQIYSIGWLGFALFVLPIVGLFAYGLFRISRDRKLWNLRVLSLAAGIALLLAVAYFSGHIVEELFPMLLCVALLGQLLRKVRPDHG